MKTLQKVKCDKRGSEIVQVRIPRDLWRETKHAAADRDINASAVLSEAVREGLMEIKRKAKADKGVVRNGKR